MSMIDMLIDLQQNYDTVVECNKILKDGSYIYLLKKLKLEFNSNKERYIEKERSLQTIKEEYNNKCVEVVKYKKLIEELENKLYNDSGSDLKLIENLQNKIQKSKQVIRDIEESSLELIEKDEKITDEKELTRLELVNLKENFENCKEISNKKISKAKEDMEKAKSAIASLRKLIPGDILVKFDDIKSRKSTAVSQLQGGVCKGCKVKVSSITIDSINKSKRIVYCDNCGRIVYCNDVMDLKAAR